MKNDTLKMTLLSTAMIIAAGFSGVSSAHWTSGSLAATNGAIDVYHTSCFTWTAAGAAQATIINGDTEIASPAKRFVARVAKQCSVANATCTAATDTVTVSIAGKDGSPTVAGTGASTSTTVAAGPGVLDPAATGSGLWLAPWSAWAQTANNGLATDKSGDYIFAVAHNSATVNPYVAQIHCESVGVGLTPAPGSLNIHTGTGVTATGGTITGPYTGAPVGTTGGDWNQIINQ